MKKLTLILILFFTIFGLFAQERLSFAEVDKQTYDLYLQKDWKNLIELGKLANKQEIVFYYLQYRMGIAYFETNNYRKAIPFFKEVLAQYPNDEIGLEYLYYSYLRSNLFEDARKLWLSFEGDFRERNRFYNDQIIINGIGLEYIYNGIDNYQEKVSTTETLTQKITQNFNSFNLNMKHYSNGSFSLFHSFSFIMTNKKNYDSEYSSEAIDETIKQTEYYALGNVNISEGTNLKFGLHYVKGRFLGVGTESVSSGGWGGGNSTTSSYEETYYSYTSNNIVGFAAFEKSISNFDFQLSTSVSNLNLGFQFQPSLSVVYYPLGNSNFYWKSEAFFQLVSNDGVSNSEFISTHKMSVTLFNKLSIEPFAMYGKAQNFVVNNAYIVYNGLDAINYWYGANINIKLGRHTNFYTIYQKYNLTNEYKINQDDFNINYNSQTILGGLVWNF